MFLFMSSFHEVFVYILKITVLAKRKSSTKFIASKNNTDVPWDGITRKKNSQ